MLYDFTEKALSIPALSASNKVLQAIKRPGDQLFSYWCCWRFPFDASRQKPPWWAPARSSLVPPLSPGAWCELQSLGWQGTKGNNAPRQEVEYTLKTALVFWELPPWLLPESGGWQGALSPRPGAGAFPRWQSQSWQRLPHVGDDTGEGNSHFLPQITPWGLIQLLLSQAPSLS